MRTAIVYQLLKAGEEYFKIIDSRYAFTAGEHVTKEELDDWKEFKDTRLTFYNGSVRIEDGKSRPKIAFSIN